MTAATFENSLIKLFACFLALAPQVQALCILVAQWNSSLRPLVVLDANLGL